MTGIALDRVRAARSWGARIAPSWAIRRLVDHLDVVPPAAVALAAAGGFAWMATLGLHRADGLATPAFDQAYFQQLVWSIGRGDGFRSSFNPGSFLGLHFSPLLVLPALLESVWSDARLLTLLQSAALCAAVPAAFLLLRALLRPARHAAWLAAALAVPLPVWPITQQQVRADFHTEALALPLVLLAGWAGLTRRIPLLFGAAVVALLAKEDQVYPVALIGLLVAARAPGRLGAGPRRAGIALVGVAITWAIIVFGLLKPALRAGMRYDTDAYYAWLGGGLNVLRIPFERTDTFLRSVGDPAGWAVAGWLIVALGGLALLRPRWLALAVPPLLAHLLSRQVPQHLVLLQYGLLLVAPVLVAAGLGARRLLAIVIRRRRSARRARLRAGRPWIPRLPLAGFVAPAIVAAFMAGAVPPFTSFQQGFWDQPPAIDRLRAVASVVPADAMLSVDWGLAAPLASRHDLAVLPYDDEAAWILVDRETFVTGSLHWPDRQRIIDRLEASDRPLVVDDGRFRLWGPADG